MLNQSFFIARTVLLTYIIILGVSPTAVQATMFVPGKYVEEMVPPKAPQVVEPQLVKGEPICSPNKRPEIIEVEPDEVKPGDKMIVTGRYFGENKECLYNVTIGTVEGENPTYINDKKLEVTVPDSAKPGMTFLNIQAGGGAARSAILVQSDK